MVEINLKPESSQKSSQKFSRSRKILSPQEFKKIISSGKKIRSQFITLFVLQNKISKSRFGFSISKKIAVAAKRNRMRRMLREFIRKHTLLNQGSVDVVLIIRVNFLNIKKDELYQHLEDFFNQVIQRKFTVC